MNLNGYTQSPWLPLTNTAPIKGPIEGPHTAEILHEAMPTGIYGRVTTSPKLATPVAKAGEAKIPLKNRRTLKDAIEWVPTPKLCGI